MIKIGIVLGTRPEAIKLIPLYKALSKKQGFLPKLISTGQHREMLYQIFDFFEEKPDVELSVMTSNQTLAGLTANLSNALQSCFDELKPDLIIVQGDTTTAFVTSLIAYYNRIPVAHVEAGLRTHNKYSPFPEEVNRKLISGIADYHFAPTALSCQNLVDEKVALNSIIITGNTVIDSLFWTVSKLQTGYSNLTIEKLIKQIKPSEPGWDGTYNGNSLPATDYWFTVYYKEQNSNQQFSSHFSLVR